MNGEQRAYVRRVRPDLAPMEETMDFHLIHVLGGGFIARTADGEEMHNVTLVAKIDHPPNPGDVAPLMAVVFGEPIDAAAWAERNPAFQG